MNSTQVATRVGAGIVLLAVGFWLGTNYRTESAPAAGVVRIEATEVTPLHEENRELKAELARPTPTGSAPRAAPANELGESDAARANATTPWLVLADLQRRKLATPGITFLGGNGKLTDAFATLFALEPAERATMQRAVDAASQRLADLNREHGTVTRNENGEVVIAVTSFAAEGGAAYDTLMKSFADTLGDARNAAFLTLGAEQVERAMGRFGAPEQTITVSYKTGANGGYFAVQEKFKLPQENSTSAGVYRTIEDVENRLGPVARLVPADLIPPK